MDVNITLPDRKIKEHVSTKKTNDVLDPGGHQGMPGYKFYNRLE